MAIGLYFTWRRIRALESNLRLSEKGHTTDRFSKAVELLSSEKTQSRLGGIYALGQIAKDSPRDHQIVMQILSAHARSHGPFTLNDRKTASDKLHVIGKKATEADPEMQAIFLVVGTRNAKYDDANQTISLSECNFRGVSIKNGDFTNVNFAKSLILQAFIEETSFKGANFGGSMIVRSSFTNAEFTDSYLVNTNLYRSFFYISDFLDSELTSEQISHADFVSCRNTKGQHFTHNCKSQD